MISYFIRLILILLRSVQEEKDFNKEAEFAFRPWPMDCDTNGHVNTARYFVFMEMARLDLARRSGLLMFCLRNRLSLMAMSAKITFWREIKAFQKLTVKSKVVGYDDKFICFEQKIVSDEGVHSVAVLRVALRGKGYFYKPEDLMRDLHFIYEAKPFPDHVAQWLSSEDAVVENLKAGR